MVGSNMLGLFVYWLDVDFMSNIFRIGVKLSTRQSSGKMSLFLKTFLLIFWKLLLYSCWYFDIALLVYLIEYVVVILQASLTLEL